MTTAAAYEEPAFILSQYGLQDETFGIIYIPKLDVTLPLYLGANNENMASGAAVLGQTSVPIGGMNTNAVIAGHRGWNGYPYFLHLDELQIGDLVYIDNIWALMKYEVVDIQIISPDDIDAIYALLKQIDEFFTMRSKTEEENREDILNSMTNEGRIYGVFENGTLAAVAGTSAENSMSAMVVSVATLPEYRGRGYATRLVTRLCQDCLADGMKFLCLFYDNPEAGVIYRKIGFKELGQYAMVRSIEK